MSSLLRVLAIGGIIAFLVAPALAQDDEAPAVEESAKPDESGEATDGTAKPTKRRRGRKRIWLPLSPAQRAERAAAAAKAAAEKAAAEKAAATESAPAATVAAGEEAPTAPAAAAAVMDAGAGAEAGVALALAEQHGLPAPGGEPLAQPGHGAVPAAAGQHATAPAAHGEHAASPAGHGAGHGDAHGGGHEGFKVGTFILQLVNFGVLLFLLIYFGGRAMNKALRARHEQLKGDIGEATRLRDEAKQKFDAQEKRIVDLEKEIATLRASMRKDAEREQARLIEAAQERGKRMQEDMRLQIDEQVKVAEATLRAEVATASVQLAEELARKAVSFDDERRLAREFVAGFDETSGTGGEVR